METLRERGDGTAGVYPPVRYPALPAVVSLGAGIRAMATERTTGIPGSLCDVDRISYPEPAEAVLNGAAETAMEARYVGGGSFWDDD